jgi:hypothetical protein
MTTTDYLLNALFILLVLLQARERRLELRSLLAPLAVVLVVAHQYVHSIPSAGNDLLPVGLLAAAGLALGIASGLATHVRLDASGAAWTRVGWLAGVLLLAGISARVVFAFAVSHGAAAAVRTFSIANHIGLEAWPLALVSMGLLEVVARLLTIQVRARRLAAPQAPSAITAAAQA